MSPITTERLIALLGEYTAQAERSVDLLLVNGLALQAYGYHNRATQDVDGELIGDLDSRATFLRDRGVPADLGENMSGWSVVAMPPGYRERASVWLDQPGAPPAPVASHRLHRRQLRRGTDLDLTDAEFVARRFNVTPDAVRRAAEASIAASPRDTTLFLFRKLVDLFCGTLAR